MKKQVQNHIRWSRYGDRNEISLQEAQMRTFNNFIWRFAQTEGNYNFSSGSRGKGNLSSEANPYFLFPQIYNFRYNIFSSEWPVANRVIELYLQKNQRMEVGSVRLMVLVIMKRLFCCWRSVHLKNCWSIWNCATCRIISSDRKQAVFCQGRNKYGRRSL